VIDQPRAPITATRRMAALGELVTKVTEQPWSLGRDDRDRAHLAGLSDEDLLHAIALTAYFGHLNRIADAVAIPLDYQVQRMPPASDPSVPALAPATIAITGRPGLDLARRPATAAALIAWRSYMFDRDAPLTRRSRTVIARWVALWLGDGGISAPADLTVNPLDDALRELAELVTLAPWQLTDQSFARLRAAGYDDAQLFDAVATASSTGVFSRITVALGAIGRARG
jgi:alkylhydroperoxidase family enzyme